MYNLFNNSDVIKFKERLAKARKDKGLTQEALGEALGLNRQTVANWEHKKGTTLPPLATLSYVCAILETDPNYLLGVSEFPVHNLESISKELTLSYDSTKKLHNASFTNVFIDYLLQNKKFHSLTHEIKQLCYSDDKDNDLTQRLTTPAVKKLAKAFKVFYNDTFFNMSKHSLKKHVVEIFDYRDTQSFDDFIKNTLTDNEQLYFSFCKHPNIDTYSDEDKFDAIMDFIAEIGYEYEFNLKMREIYIDKTHRHMAEIIEDFIDKEVKKRHDGIYIGYL